MGKVSGYFSEAKGQVCVYLEVVVLVFGGTP